MKIKRSADDVLLSVRIGSELLSRSYFYSLFSEPQHMAPDAAAPNYSLFLPPSSPIIMSLRPLLPAIGNVTDMQPYVL